MSPDVLRRTFSVAGFDVPVVAGELAADGLLLGPGAELSHQKEAPCS